MLPPHSSKFASPATGAATAAVAAFVGFQKMASAARDTRIEAQKLGTNVGFYRDLSWNARMAGVSLETVAAGMEKVNATASEAAGGDISSMAYFAGLGVSPDKLQGMQGDRPSSPRSSPSGAIGPSRSRCSVRSTPPRRGQILRLQRPRAEPPTMPWKEQSPPFELPDRPLRLQRLSNSGLSHAAYATQARACAYGGGMSFARPRPKWTRSAGKEGKQALG